MRWKSKTFLDLLRLSAPAPPTTQTLAGIANGGASSSSRIDPIIGDFRVGDALDVWGDTATGVARGWKPDCSALLATHSFGASYGAPLVTDFSMESCAAPTTSGSAIDSIVLELDTACAGLQFDRVAAVWIGGG